MQASSQFVNIICIIVGLVFGLGFAGMALRHENISFYGVPEPVFSPTLIMVMLCAVLFAHGVMNFVRERKRVKMLISDSSKEATDSNSEQRREDGASSR